MGRVLISILCLMMISYSASAEIISRDVLDASSTITNISTIFDTIINEINGNLDTKNIKADSLTEACFSDNINPRVRDYEFLGDFTYTGQIPSTSSSLATTISAGTSYVKGFRIVTSSTSKTFAASVDTWVYIDQNGAFQYVEVALGAAQPTTPTNSLLLAKVTTSGTAVTSVTDKRTTAPPGIRTYEKYRQGYYFSRDVTSPLAQFKVSAGEIDLGSSGRKRINTTATTVTWTDLDTGSEAASHVYFVWAYPSTANATESAFKISLSSSDATGVSDERLVGWFYNDAASNITADNVSTNWKGDGSGSPNIVSRTTAGGQAITSATYVDVEGTTIYFYSTGRPCRLTYNGSATAASGITNVGMAFSVDGGDIGDKIFTNATAGYYFPLPLELVMPMAEGFHTIKARVSVSGSTLTTSYQSITVEEL